MQQTYFAGRSVPINEFLTVAGGQFEIGPFISITRMGLQEGDILAVLGEYQIENGTGGSLQAAIGMEINAGGTAAIFGGGNVASGNLATVWAYFTCRINNVGGIAAGVAVIGKADFIAGNGMSFIAMNDYNDVVPETLQAWIDVEGAGLNMRTVAFVATRIRGGSLV